MNLFTWFCRMSIEDLIQAVKRNNEEEVLRLIDEEDIDVNDRNMVSVYFLFSVPFHAFCQSSWKQLLWLPHPATA